MLGLLGLRIFEATGADITDLGEEHSHRVLRVCGKGTHTRKVSVWQETRRVNEQKLGCHDHPSVLTPHHYPEQLCDVAASPPIHRSKETTQPAPSPRPSSSPVQLQPSR